MATQSRERKSQRATSVKKRAAAKPGNLAGTEPQLWANCQATAEQAIAFWESFLDLRKAGNASLSGTDRGNLLKIVRAVSWVESKHGTMGANRPGRDPMQCGNPGRGLEAVRRCDHRKG